jgi:hypothetical protein
VSLKVLDANGAGTISNIIQALDWVVANKDTYHIRVVNLSVGAGIHESYWTDPLTLAAKRAVDAGVVVVAAAGNLGKNSLGQPQYGGITAPGNAPWVLTVGASTTMGTPNRGDDTMAGYSSRGPTSIDYDAKPDLVAPGTGTVSLAVPGSHFYVTKPTALIAGTLQTPFIPYLSLTGTSMAAPAVSGTVALMLQANPSLTPNAVKAILQYTSQWNSAYNGLTQGAGFLNTVGAVRLASFYATAQPGEHVPVQTMWSKHILWGNHMLTHGVLRMTANAWGVGVNWGAVQAADGSNITWGSECAVGDPSCDNIVWGSADDIVWGSLCLDALCTDIVWGGIDPAPADNIVWGSDCAGADCDNVVWGSTDPVTNVMWGSAAPSDNVLWGSVDCADPDPTTCDNIVWGSTEDDEGDNVVWGSTVSDDIVWSSAVADNILWGSDCDPALGGCDNIVWGSDANGNVVFADVSATGTVTQVQLGQLTDGQLLKLMIQMTAPPPPPPPPPPPVDPPPPPPPDTTTTTTPTTTTDTTTTTPPPPTPTDTTTTTTTPPPPPPDTTTTDTTTTTTTDSLTNTTTTTSTTTTVTTHTDPTTLVVTTTTSVTTTITTTDTLTNVSTTSSSTTTTSSGGI